MDVIIHIANIHTVWRHWKWSLSSWISKYHINEDSRS